MKLCYLQMTLTYKVSIAMTTKLKILFFFFLVITVTMSMTTSPCTILFQIPTILFHLSFCCLISFKPISVKCTTQLHMQPHLSPMPKIASSTLSPSLHPFKKGIPLGQNKSITNKAPFQLTWIHLHKSQLSIPNYKFKVANLGHDFNKSCFSEKLCD